MPDQVFASVSELNSIFLVLTLFSLSAATYISLARKFCPIFRRDFFTSGLRVYVKIRNKFIGFKIHVAFRLKGILPLLLHLEAKC